jgi:hypothetical protein
MGDLFAGVTEFLQGVISILHSLIVPTDPATGAVDWTLLTGDPIKLMIWFALIFAFVPMIYNFLLNTIQGARGGYEDDAWDRWDEENDPDFLGWENHGDRAALARFEKKTIHRAYGAIDENGLPRGYYDERSEDYRAWVDHGDQAAFQRWSHDYANKVRHD